MESCCLIEDNKRFTDVTGFTEHLNHFDKFCRERVLFSKSISKVQL